MEMISAAVIRRWYWVHTWTSLICTLFLLMLCLTGLPLIFHHELDHLLSDQKHPAELPAGTPFASFDALIESAKKERPGEVVHLVFTEAGEEERLYVGLGKTPEAPFAEDTGIFVDTRTGEVLGTTRVGEGGLVEWLFRLHVDMFMGIPGKLFLGVMAGLFLLALISGVVLYAPFMRDRSFGVVRRTRGRRLKWLDLHNVLGIGTVVWALVVGGTGMLNTWADSLLKLWQFRELGTMIAPYKELPAPTTYASFQKAVDAALAKEPSMEFAFATFPGTAFSGNHHYAIFLRGKAAFNSRMLKPVLIDAATGEFSATRDMPWYIVALLVSQPLHFGDYGGLPLQILWAILDVITIIVLLSGLYLWWVKHRQPVELDYRDGTLDAGASTPAKSV